jgi:hypothetical protein
MTTEDDQELLSAYLDNQLSAAERLTFERRLQSNTALQDELQELRALKSLLGDLPALMPARSFTLDPATVAPPRRFALFGVLRLGSLLATLLLALTFTFDFFGPARMPQAPQADQQARQAVQPTLGDIASQAQEAQPNDSVGVLKAPAAAGAAQLSTTPGADTRSDAYVQPTEPLEPVAGSAANSEQVPAPTIGASGNSSPDTTQTNLPPVTSAQSDNFSVLRWLQIILAAIALACGVGAFVAWQQRR